MARLLRVFLPRFLSPTSADFRSCAAALLSALRRPAPTVFALLLVFGAGCARSPDDGVNGTGGVGAVGAVGDVGAVAVLLTEVRVVPERVTVLGYDRSRFGGWAPVPPRSGVPTGSDTRDAVVAEWFGAGDGAGSAPITDPYTGDGLIPDGADVDHIYPLAAAWDFGAFAWNSRSRRAFANDAELNLVPVASTINREKSDLTPGEWLPPARELRCDYSHRYLRVAIAWDLPVSVADWQAMAGACGIRTRIGYDGAPMGNAPRPAVSLINQPHPPPERPT